MSNRDKIDLNYRNILKDEFQVTLSDTATRVQVIRKLNSELNDFISNEDEKITLKRHVLFVFDNVKREEEIEEYLSDLPPKIKILITRGGNFTFLFRKEKSFTFLTFLFLKTFGTNKKMFPRTQMCLKCDISKK